ncbi:MAG TPA: phytanoyl-CoA dioxygenase family protein [Stellaceae bacterium]|nr:phytanoyl-CoA dioxygenase family protein [Stellaceae bacterium]
MGEALAGPIDRIETWQRLVPDLTICAPDAMAGFAPIDFPADTLAGTKAGLIEEGYFQLDPPEWGLPWDRMAAAVGTLRQAGLSTCFAFMYDQFWMAFARLHKLLAHDLDPGYQLLPAFWAWHIDPKSDESGWTPHRDRGRMALFPDGAPKALTIWLPLTDATTLNGCMYLVPADRDRHYNTEHEDNPNFAYSDVRALPAKAGSVLCWNQAVLHWGSHSAKRAPGPRLSMAFEFQRGDIPPLHQMLIPPLALPDFRDRLILTCVQILQYKHMYPLAPEMEAMVNGVLAGMR